MHDPIMNVLVKFHTFDDFVWKGDTFWIDEMRVLWGGIAVLLYKKPAYDQYIKADIYENQSLHILMDDDNIMKQLFDVVNNGNGMRLAIQMVDSCKFTDYSAFISKYFNIS